MTYGMGPKHLSESMNVSLEEATKIVEDFHSGFPQMSTWMSQTQEDACKTGYVEDFWGRRRRLPDLLLPEYSFKFKNSSGFNPLLNSNGKYEDSSLVEKYQAKLNSIKNFRDYDPIKKEASKEGLEIIKNGGFVSRAKRQCVNARIQGSASTMTKKAMIALYNDEEMKKYGFKLLIGVHDELIGECFEEYAEEASARLVEIMKTCTPELDVPIKCDPTIEKNWNEEEYVKGLKNELKETGDVEKVVANHIECTREQILEFLK